MKLRRNSAGTSEQAFDIPLGESAAITGDFRYVFLDYDFEEVPGSDGISSNFFVIKAGLMFIIN